MEKNTTSQLKCLECGAELAEGQRFCAGCGAKCPPPTPVPEPEPEHVDLRICSECGAILIEDQKFCSECGTKCPPLVPISESDPEPEYEPEPNPEKEEKRERCCLNCNSILNEDQMFCGKCGTRVAKDSGKIVCDICGNTFDSDNMYCPNCGRRVPKKKDKTPKKKNEKAVQQKTGVFEIVKHGLLLVLSILMFVSVFMPAAICVPEDEDNYFAEDVEYSACDAISLLFASFVSMQPDEIEKTDEYEEMTQLYEKYCDVWEKGRKTDKKLEYLKLSTILMLKREDCSPSFSLIMSGMASIAYAVLSVTFLICSLFSFIRTLLSRSKHMWNACLRLASFIAPAAAVICISFKFTPVMFFGETTKVGAWPVTVAVLSLVFMLFLMIMRIVWAKRKLRALADLVKRWIVAAICISVMVISCMSLVEMTVRAEFVASSADDIWYYYPGEVDRKWGEVSFPKDAGIFSYLECNEKERADFWEYRDDKITEITDLMGYIRNYKKNDFSENGEYIMLSMLKHSIWNRMENVLFSSAGIIPLMLMLTCVGIVFANCMYIAATDKRRLYGTIIAKILAIVFAALLLTVILIMANISKLKWVDSGAFFGVVPHLNTYILIGATAVLACIPIGKSKKITYSDSYLGGDGEASGEADASDERPQAGSSGAMQMLSVAVTLIGSGAIIALLVFGAMRMAFPDITDNTVEFDIGYNEDDIYEFVKAVEKNIEADEVDVSKPHYSGLGFDYGSYLAVDFDLKMPGKVEESVQVRFYNYYDYDYVNNIIVYIFEDDSSNLFGCKLEVIEAIEKTLCNESPAFGYLYDLNGYHNDGDVIGEYDLTDKAAVKITYDNSWDWTGTYRLYRKDKVNNWD